MRFVTGPNEYMELDEVVRRVGRAALPPQLDDRLRTVEEDLRAVRLRLDALESLVPPD